uniref:Uncharacterized protein n=1 Tax=Oryza glaberrima TaxID=4538 RepID=I1PV62_ORYGL
MGPIWRRRRRERRASTAAAEGEATGAAAADANPVGGREWIWVQVLSRVAWVLFVRFAAAASSSSALRKKGRRTSGDFSPSHVGPAFKALFNSTQYYYNLNY